MADEQIKELLREIRDAQRQQLEYLQRQDSTYAQHVKQYESSRESWEQSLQGSRWASLIRAITVLGIVFLLGYIILNR